MVKVSYLIEFLVFMKKHNIDIPNMDYVFLTQGRPRRKAHEITYLHYYQVELFNFFKIRPIIESEKLLIHSSLVRLVVELWLNLGRTGDVINILLLIIKIKNKNI